MIDDLDDVWHRTHTRVQPETEWEILKEKEDKQIVDIVEKEEKSV
jgi:hypothetical protein